MKNFQIIRKGLSCKIMFALVLVTTIISTCSIQLGGSNIERTGISWPHKNCDLRRGSFAMGRLVIVDCYSCTEIPTNMVSPEHVGELDMKIGNHIDILRNGSLIRSKLTRLEILNLENCKIRIVEPGALAGTNSLRTICLSNNLITVLDPDVFRDVPSLKFLNISNNPINIVKSSETYPDLIELVTLDLSNCRLDTFPTNIFDSMENLQTLNLTGNNFKYFDWRVLQKKNNFTILKLDANPWHCDCHVKFLMETLKNMSLANVFENITCYSAEMPKWKGELWNQVPGEDMACHPEINKLVYSSLLPLSQPSEPGNWRIKDKTVQLNDDVYFKCEYSGFPKPDVQWFKNNQLITDIKGEPGDLGNNIQSKIEIMDDTSKILQKLGHGEATFNYKFRDVLVIHRIQVNDKGSYTCAVAYNHIAAHKTVSLPRIKIPHNEKSETALTMWTWISIVVGLLFAVLIASLAVFTWVKRGRGEDRGIIQESNIELGEIKSSNLDLISMFKDPSDTSLI